MFLDYLGGVYVNIVVVEDNPQRIEVWLLQRENNCPIVGGRYRFEYHISESPRNNLANFGETAAKSQETVIVVLDILGSQLPPVHRRLIMPVNALTDFEDNS